MTGPVAQWNARPSTRGPAFARGRKPAQRASPASLASRGQRRRPCDPWSSTAVGAMLLVKLPLGCRSIATSPIPMPECSASASREQLRLVRARQNVNKQLGLYGAPTICPRARTRPQASAGPVAFITALPSASPQMQPSAPTGAMASAKAAQLLPDAAAQTRCRDHKPVSYPARQPQSTSRTSQTAPSAKASRVPHPRCPVANSTPSAIGNAARARTSVAWIKPRRLRQPAPRHFGH